MRHSVLLLACLCALATGLVLLALAREVTRPAVPTAGAIGGGRAEVALVRRFYAAANAVLATGDGSLLAETVAPDLAEHPARTGAAAGRDGLVRALLSLRATFPGLTLVVDDVRAADDDQVVARVHAEGAGSGEFLGRPIAPSLGRWGPLEVWRVADGRLAERWGAPDPVALLPLGQAPVDLDALGPGRRRATLTRMTAEPGATLPVDNGPAVRLFAVEAGTLTVTVGARSGGAVTLVRGSAAPAAVVPGESVAVAPGDLLATAPEADYTLANAGRTPALAVAVVVSNAPGGGSPQSNPAAAASWQVAAMPEALGGALPSPFGFAGRAMASNAELAVPTRSVLAIGWVVLAPGATLGLPPENGALLAAVDGGRVDLTPIGGPPAATLAAGEATVLPATIGSTWRAGDDAPAVVLILAVTASGSTPAGTDHPPI